MRAEAYDLTHERTRRNEAACPKRLILEGIARERLESLNRDAIKHMRISTLEREFEDLGRQIDKLRADSMILADIAEILEVKREQHRRELANLSTQGE